MAKGRFSFHLATYYLYSKHLILCSFFFLVFVGGLDADTEKGDLEDFFRKAGPINSIWVAKKPPVRNAFFSCARKFFDVFEHPMCHPVSILL
jgi:hypothetical protein